MNRDRLINTVILILLGVGLFALYDQLAHLNQRQLLSVVGKAIAALSLPFGLAVKLVQYLISEKDRLFKLAESASATADSNRVRIEVAREELDKLRADLAQSAAGLNEELLDLDRRLIRFEARSGISQQLESVRAQLNELSDRFDKWMMEREE